MAAGSAKMNATCLDIPKSCISWKVGKKAIQGYAGEWEEIWWVLIEGACVHDVRK
jgi:hypothetical protein